MIDPETIQNDYPVLARALGGGPAAQAAIDELMALLRRAGVELPGYPPEAVGAADDASQDATVIEPETELTRGEFFQVLTGGLPERLAE